jgi:regulator of sigma E protease
MITTIIIFLAVLSVLVIAHEWGHYAAAKKMGMKVEEFGLGFPPRLFKWKGKDGMIWSINLIPLGGFVKIKGESGEHKDAKDSFAKKSIPARIFVLSAGVMMNLVLAAVMLSVALAIGTPTIVEDGAPKGAIVTGEAIQILELVEEGPADVAGIELGDKVISVDGAAQSSAEGLRDTLGEGGTFSMEILRGEETVTLEVTSTYLEEAEAEAVGILVLDTANVRYPVYLAPIKGVELTAYYTKEITVAFVEIIGDLITRDEIEADLAGPVGIATITGEIAARGIAPLLQFMAILSMNLAVLNILPFPALDGGRIGFALLEAVRRKPTSPEFEAIVHNLGFLVLILLIVFVTYKDIARIVVGG